MRKRNLFVASGVSLLLAISSFVVFHRAMADANSIVLSSAQSMALKVGFVTATIFVFLAVILFIWAVNVKEK